MIALIKAVHKNSMFQTDLGSVHAFHTIERDASKIHVIVNSFLGSFAIVSQGFRFLRNSYYHSGSSIRSKLSAIACGNDETRTANPGVAVTKNEE